jgi:hypothetical protein
MFSDYMVYGVTILGYEDNDPSFEQERLTKLLYPAGY